MFHYGLKVPITDSSSIIRFMNQKGSMGKVINISFDSNVGIMGLEIRSVMLLKQLNNSCLIPSALIIEEGVL
jgi:hypothetical protein